MEDDTEFNNLAGLVDNGEEEKYDIVASSPEAQARSGLKNSVEISDSKGSNYSGQKNSTDNSLQKRQESEEPTLAPPLSVSPQRNNPLGRETGQVKES